ncbi:MAG: pectate lyase [Planctomycetota bacterium]|nr:MAG: pectate lyase [Planctomycetota bacterium]
MANYRIMKHLISTILTLTILSGTSSGTSWEESFEGKFKKSYLVEPQEMGGGWSNLGINPAAGYSGKAGEVTLTNTPTRNGGGALKCVRSDKGRRMEFELVNRDETDSPRIGQHCWAALSILVPEASMNHSGMVIQWHGGVPNAGNGKEYAQGPEACLRLDNGQFIYRSNFKLSKAAPPGNRETRLLEKATPGQWYDFVFHHYFSLGDDGLTEIWLQGKRVCSDKGPNAFYYRSKFSFKFGSYGSTTGGTIYFDEAKVLTGSGSYDQIARGKAKQSTEIPAVPVPDPKASAVSAEPAFYWEGALRPFMLEKPEWYANAEAVRIANNLLVYQCDSGGWPKTISFKKRINMTAVIADADRSALLAAKSRTDSTIDNASTYTQIEYLARVFNATKQETFKEACLKGIDFLLEAQYENGGWPQFYPYPKDKEYLARIVSNRDEKEYFLHITFNDEAMVSVMRLLQRIAKEETTYAFVDAGRRTQCGRAVAKGIECILACQVVVNGKRTVWCAQHDEKTLAPAGARVYEKVSLSGHESVSIVRLLMNLESPSAEVIQAIQSATAWFEAAKIKGLRVVDRQAASLPTGRDRVVVADPNADPLWARFHDIHANQPIFCGNNGIAKHSLAEIEPERRTGYMWYCTTPAELLQKDYPEWQKKWAPEKNVLTK